MSKKAIPKIGTQEFAEDIQLAFKSVYEMLAEKYTKGDEEKFAEHVAYSSLVLVPKRKVEGIPERNDIEPICGGIVGSGSNLVKIAGVIVQECAKKKAERSGCSMERALSSVLAMVHQSAAGMMEEKEMKNFSIGSDEVAKFKESLKGDGLKAILSILEETKGKKPPRPKRNEGQSPFPYENEE